MPAEAIELALMVAAKHPGGGAALAVDATGLPPDAALAVLTGR